MIPPSPIPTIGRYELKDVIGRGGMATVYRGYDPRFRREVAIKVMTQDLLGDAVLRARFEREAQTIAALEHPAIVPVYDFGDEQGRPYLVMRLMPGGTLADRLRQGALTTDETARILQRIGAALERAHQKGIIHRDLKPSNIMFDEYGDAFLADFGIARLTESAVTLTGEAVIGTPAYMSPEQVNGDKALDRRSDIYALGVICFEMLTGRPPFQGDTAARIMMKHVLEPAPDIRQMKPDLPPGVEAVIARTLAKTPDERFATASELSDTLSRLLRREGTPATQPAAPPLAPVPPAISQEGPTQVDQTVQPAPAAVSVSQDGPTEVDLGVTETEVMQPTFARQPARAAAPGGAVPARRWLVAGVVGLVALALLLGGGFVVASLLGRGEGESGDEDESVAVIATEEGTAGEATEAPARPTPSRTPRATATANLQLIADSHMERFYGFMEAGDFEAALEEVNLALRAVDDPWYHHERASVLRLLGRLEAALEEINNAVYIEPTNAEHYALRGIIRRDLGNLGQALSDHRRIVEMVPDNDYFHHELASTYRAMENFQAAVAEWDTALELNPDIFWYYIDQADAYRNLSDFDAAMADLNEAVDRFPDEAEVYANRGSLFVHNLGNPEAALADLNQAIALNGEMGWFYFDRAIAWRDLGDYEAAIADFLQVIALEPENEWPYVEKGWIYLYNVEQPEAALEAFDEAIGLNPDNSAAYLGRGLALIAAGHEAGEAFDAWNACLDLNPDEYWCYWEKAHLHNSLNQIEDAVHNFELYLAHVPEGDCPDCQTEAQNYIESHDN
jgi:serine/threonine-protein kinase